MRRISETSAVLFVAKADLAVADHALPRGRYDGVREMTKFVAFGVTIGRRRIAYRLTLGSELVDVTGLVEAKRLTVL